MDERSSGAGLGDDATDAVDAQPTDATADATGDLLPGEGHEVDELKSNEQRRNFWALVWAQAASVGYGALRTGFLGVIVGRYTTSALAISFAVTANRFFQPVLNPVIGRFSDKSQSRHGRRKPFMVAGLVIMGFSLAAVPVATGYWPLVIVASVSSVGAAFYRIPRFSVTPEIFGQHRWAAMAVSIGVAGILPNFVMQVVINRTWAESQDTTFVIAGAACLLGAVVLAMRMLEPTEAQSGVAEATAEHKMRERIATMRSHKNLMVLLVAGSIATIGGEAVPALYVIYAGEILHVGGETVAAAAIVGALCFAPLTVPAILIGLRVDRHYCAMACSLFGVVLAIAAYFANSIVTLTVVGVLGALSMTVVAVNLGPLVTLLFPRELLGEMAAIWSSFTTIGAIAVTYGTAFFVDWLHNYRIIWLPIAVALSVTAVVLTRLDLPPRHRHPDRSELRKTLGSSFRQGLSRNRDTTTNDDSQAAAVIET